ncbi:MAG TPA: YcgN family cysteine cluster protein [Candidatus Sulfotelmatobacter sp.]|jgi:uncharacterized cysteine cluster protein YcgN (CxxCxxCC family)|nr:YcgN family cysteine cluster protein [Candidatus Sulfotelmatobacter sp.]
MNDNADQPFWKTKTLAEMTPEEWESLCDGCGKCCLHKLQYEDSDDVMYTNVGCRLLDLTSCRCSKYAERQKHVPDCVQLTPEEVANLKWLPSTCAYGLLAKGKELPKWHPLVTGDPNSVHDAGQSIRGRSIPERRARHLERYIVTWPE